MQEDTEAQFQPDTDDDAAAADDDDDNNNEDDDDADCNSISMSSKWIYFRPLCIEMKINTYFIVWSLNDVAMVYRTADGDHLENR